MTARAELLAALSAMCARCDGPMVVTKDAIGRDRLRCPKCDGVSRVRPHPDEVLLPQGLVRANALPAIQPGQLRCQRCAKGVAPERRFCNACSRTGKTTQRAYKPKTCGFCGASFAPTGPRARFCEACR